jgi:hypothetical protein
MVYKKTEHQFCEAEKRKILALRKIIAQEKTLKKISQVIQTKYIYYIEISLNTSFF